MTSLIEKKLLEIKTKAITLKSYWLMLGEIRLDASFYAEKSQKALRLLNESGYELTKIDELSKDVFNPPPIRRQYSGTKGTPYLMPTELFLLRLKPTKFVFAHKMENIQDWFVKEGWIMLTQSGKVGMPLFITKSMEKFVISQNAIRIVPKEGTYPGFLYAYLSTWFGQSLITKTQFGVTVEHIRPHHVSQIPVPLIPNEVQKQIHLNIVKVFELRDKARELLEQAEQAFLRELKLPLYESASKITKVFNTNARKLNLRLDASYHDPIVENIHTVLQKSGSNISPLGKISDVIIPPRFKRVYVEEEYGTPFLQGTDIPLINPRLLKYLSNKVTRDIAKWIIHSGWILVTCSGTIGKVAMAPREWNGWAASQHILRIIPHTEKIDAGFLTIFLMSDYGYQQVASKIYGGVVDELAEDDMKDVLVPLPSRDVQKEIGNLVVEAYELKELANKIEDETVRMLENMLEEHRKVEVNEEYLKEINSYADSFELIGNEEFRESREELESGATTSFDEFKKEHRL